MPGKAAGRLGPISTSEVGHSSILWDKDRGDRDGRDSRTVLQPESPHLALGSPFPSLGSSGMQAHVPGKRPLFGKGTLVQGWGGRSLGSWHLPGRASLCQDTRQSHVPAEPGTAVSGRGQAGVRGLGS